jgi:hypothetical protein
MLFDVRAGMDAMEQRGLFEATELAGLERAEVEGEIQLFYRGVPVYAFGADDPIGRDFVIASLLRSGLQGKTVAKLCGVSAGHVTGVRQRVAAGGFEALASRGRPGRPAKLTGSQLQRLRDLHATGMSMSEMGRVLGVSHHVVRQTLIRLELPTSPSERRQQQPPLAGIGRGQARTELEEPSRCAPTRGIAEVAVADTNEDEELLPGAELPPGPTEHPSRYAGTLLLAAAMAELGVPEALDEASVRRRDKAVYDARQMVVALACAWIAGFESLESMHERDARGLGVVLGLERSPSVRTAHRAIGDMVERFDPIALGTSLMHGLRAAGGQQPLLFGIDGHFKEYAGDAPIDKGWNPHKRLATKGLGLMMVHDTIGATWLSLPVDRGDSVSQHVLTAARRLRHVHGADAPIVLGFDRGGFRFETLRALDREGFGYLAWVPASAKTPSLATVAPSQDGVGAVVWEHGKLGHSARLLVQRDGAALLPAVTNLDAEVEPADAMRMLRRVRGVEENAIKSARASTHIDRLVDRGIEREQPDDRPVKNRARTEMRDKKKQIGERLDTLDEHEALEGRRHRAVAQERFLLELQEAVLGEQLRQTPTELPRVAVDPEATRAWLRTKNRALLVPLKLAADNARRWLLATLGTALAPTDHDYDASAMPRTLMALLRAPGTVRFDRDHVEVTLELPLPPTAHARIDEALRALDHRALLFPDKRGPDLPPPRKVRFRLAPRATRATLPHAAPRETSA